MPSHANEFRSSVIMVYSTLLFDGPVALYVRGYFAQPKTALLLRTEMAIYSRLVFWTFAQKLKVKKTQTQAQKTQNSRIFCPKLNIPANFSEVPNMYNKFRLKSGKIVQKLKKLPTQGKISQNLKFPANPLSSKARKTSKKA